MKENICFLKVIHFLWKNRDKWFLCSEISFKIECPESTVRYIVKQLEKLGMIESDGKKFGR